MRFNDTSNLTRRAFLKWNAAATVIATTGLTGCGGDNDTEYITEPVTVRDIPDKILEGGEWKTAICWNGCGGGCINQAYVKDGAILRTRTDESHPDSVEWPQQRGCVKGRSNRRAVYSPDRIKYPMKRKSWSPGGGSGVNADKRGKDEWVRISWDEALDIVCKETERIVGGFTEYNSDVTFTAGPNRGQTHTVKLKYGAHNERIFNLSAQWDCPAFNFIGGTVSQWGHQSQGGFPLVANMIRGRWSGDAYGPQDRLTLLDNTKRLVIWCWNSAWSKQGNLSYMIRTLHEKGVKIYSVDPWFNTGNQAFVDQWVPCRPGTDVALILAIAHEMIKNNWYDASFLNKYTVGFDAEHMPLYDKHGDAILDDDGNSVIEVVGGQERHKDYKNNFKDYVLGTYDGQPKNPAWAAEICGTPPELITELAEFMKSDPSNPLALRVSYASGRTSIGGDFCHAFYTLGWMTGSIGYPGAEVTACNSSSWASTGSQRLIVTGGRQTPSPAYPANRICMYPRGQGTISSGKVYPEKTDGTYNTPSNPWATSGDVSTGWTGDAFTGNGGTRRYYGMAYSDIWNGILTGKHKHFGTEWTCDFRMLIKFGEGSRINQIADSTRAVAAFRSPKVEFIAVTEFFFTPDCEYADLILPACTAWEKEGWPFRGNVGNPEMSGICSGRMAQPQFESREDAWIEAALIKRWGLDPSLFYPMDNRQQIFNMIATTLCIDESDGNKRKRFIKITEDDFARNGYIKVQGSNVNNTVDVCDGIPVRTEPGGTPRIITYDEFAKKGWHQVPRKKGDNLGFVAYQDLRAATTDAQIAAIIPTQTGKFEIYCHMLPRKYAEIGFSVLTPIPKYRPARNGYEATFSNWDTKTKGPSPLQFLSVHPNRRTHGNHDQLPHLREIFVDVLWMNPIDAEARGLKNEDQVVITGNTQSSDYLKKPRKMLRRVTITPTVMPGVLITAEGPWFKFNGDDSLDIAGNPNTVTDNELCGEGQMPWNTVIVEVEKYNGDAPLPDYMWPSRLPAVENK